MIQTCFWRVIFIAVLCVTLATPANANGYPSAGAIVGGAVAVVAAAAVITVMVVHRASQKKTITGCVGSGESGISVTDERDKRTYALSANAAGINPGHRVTVQIKEVKPHGANKQPVWEITKEIKDFGDCHP